MAENKTKPTSTQVSDYFATIEQDERRRDCEALAQLMAKITNEPAVMWGSSIVGFGNYHYKYASGREGDTCMVGFSSRKSDIVLYLSSDFPGKAELLSKLGTYKQGKGCLYLRKLANADLTVLEQLIRNSFVQRQSNHNEEPNQD